MQNVILFFKKKIFIEGYKNRRMPNLLRNGSGDIITRRGMQRSPTYLNVSKNILARESIFRGADCTVQQSHMKKMPAILSDQQIKQSSIYHRLLLRIQTVKRRQQQEGVEHQRRMRWIEEELRRTREEIKEEKLQLWQVRNEVMELQEVLGEEVEEYQQLWDMLNQQIMGHQHQFMPQQDQDDQSQQYEQNQDYDEHQDENQHRYHHQQPLDSSQNNLFSQESSSRYPPSQSAQSKPTCSIKLMMSDRSITSPDNSNKQVMSELTPFANQTHQIQTQNSMQQQPSQQQQNTHPNLISFKKQQPVYSHDD